MAQQPGALRLLHARQQRGGPPPLTAAEPPEWLPADAREVWQRLTPGLVAASVLTAQDLDALMVLCVAIARHRQATEMLARTSLLVRAPGGEGLVRNPLLTVQADAERTIVAFVDRFGLAPASRGDAPQADQQ